MQKLLFLSLYLIHNFLNKVSTFFFRKRITGIVLHKYKNGIKEGAVL